MPHARPRPAPPLLLLVATLAFGLLAVGCDRPADNAASASTPGTGGGARAPRVQRDPVPVTLAPVRIETLDRTIEVVGSLFGDEEATVSAKVPGRVLRVLVDVGDRVAPGAPITLIDPTDYRLAIEQREMAMREALTKLGLAELPGEDFDLTKVATVERARFEAANALARLERARQLYNQSPPLISEQDYHDLETTFQVAQQNRDVALLEARSLLAQAHTRRSELALAQQALADTTLRAPGVAADVADADAPTAAPEKRFAVTQRLISDGEYLGQGDQTFRLVADDPIKLRAAVPERFVADVRPGQPVAVRVEGQAAAFPGRISRVNPAIDRASRTFEIEAVLPNENRQLRPGAFARAVLFVGEEAGVMFVPGEAVVSFAGTDRVFSVREDIAVEHAITPGTTRDGYIGLQQPIEGVTAVVVSGAAQLADGVPVRVDSAPPPTPNATPSTSEAP